MRIKIKISGSNAAISSYEICYKKRPKRLTLRGIVKQGFMKHYFKHYVNDKATQNKNLCQNIYVKNLSLKQF